MRYMYFIGQGEVVLKSKDEKVDLLFLPKNSWFGDYQVLLGARSNTSFYSAENSLTICLVLKGSDLVEFCH